MLDLQNFCQKTVDFKISIKECLIQGGFGGGGGGGRVWRPFLFGFNALTTQKGLPLYYFDIPIFGWLTLKFF